MIHSWEVSNREYSSVAKVGGSEKDNFNFQQHDQQHVFEGPVSCLSFPVTFDSQNPLCLSFGYNSTPQLGTVVDSFLSSDEDTFCETYSDVSIFEHFRVEHNRLVGDDDSAPVNQAEVICATSGNSASGKVATKKKRIKWTKDLHEKFVAAVNNLGGPQKAKPKAVLQMMDSKSLTIFQVKSHLQKYRSTIYVQNTFKEGSEERQCRDTVTELQQKIYMQIEESRQLQLEVQRGIQEQMEIQRNLQMLVEQQKKQLQSV